MLNIKQVFYYQVSDLSFVKTNYNDFGMSLLLGADFLIKLNQLLDLFLVTFCLPKK